MDDETTPPLPTAFWADRHRPKTRLDVLATAGFHPHIVANLQRIAASGNNMPHLLITGPSGCGKRTYIAALLHGLFGLTAEHVTVATMDVAPDAAETAGAASATSVPIVTSHRHIELNAGHFRHHRGGILDTAAVLQAMQRGAGLMSTMSAFVSPSPSESAAEGKTAKFASIVIHGAEHLSHAAQCALRWAIEASSKSCRVILSCRSASRIIDALTSRCCPILVAAPPLRALQAVLRGIVSLETIAGGRDTALVSLETSAETSADAAADSAALVDAAVTRAGWARNANLAITYMQLQLDIKNAILDDATAACSPVGYDLNAWDRAVHSTLSRSASGLATCAKLMRSGLAPAAMLEALVECVVNGNTLRTTDTQLAAILMFAATVDHRIAINPEACEAHLDAFLMHARSV